MKKIKLTTGEYTLISNKDFKKTIKYNYYLKNGYAQTTSFRNRIYLHRLIMDFPKKGLEIDHKDGNRLNNQRSNLRICTRKQNQGNRVSGKNSSSKFKGVSWEKKKLKWRASMTCNKKTIYLGSFKVEEDAALAYNKMAKKYFGKFARLNIIK